MPLKFPDPSIRTDEYASHVVNRLDALGGGSGFMVSAAELDDGRLIVALSGENRALLESHLEAQLRAVPPPYEGFRRNVIEGQISIHNDMLNPYVGRRYGLTYGGSRNCSEPKIIEMAAILKRDVLAMTTIWYGDPNNREGRKGYLKYRQLRPPLGHARQLNFANPCEICQANEARLMLYLKEGFPGRTGPRMGSYESPF